MNSDGLWDNVDTVQNDGQSTLDKMTTDEGSKIKKFRVKNYVPKNFAKTLLEVPHFIGIAIIFILIIIIIVLASIKNKGDYSKTEEVIGNVYAEILLLNGNRFWMYNRQKRSLKLLCEVENSAQAFVIDTRNTVYWIETNSWKIFSLNLFKNERKQNQSLFFEGSRSKPLRKPSMALDTINNNLYIVDESIQGLVIINTVSKYYALMLIKLVNPRYIVLDAAKGTMFISSTTGIEKADMDGNNLLTIVADETISSITLDPKEEKIYWIRNSEIIESSNYSGQQIQKVITDSESFADLTFLDDHLFWLSKSSDIQHKLMWSCKIQEGVCVNHTMHSNGPTFAGNTTFMRLTNRSRNNLIQQNSWNHQNCEHMSLATPTGPMTCVCNISSQLIYNAKCKPITKFILYTVNNEIRARTLDTTNKIILEPIWPTPYLHELLSKKNNIDFDYDFENDDFYFSDDKKIYKLKLKGSNPQQEVVLTSNSDEIYIQNLAYDWLSKNVYYLKISELYGVHSIVAFNIKEGAVMQKTIKKFEYHDYSSRNSIFVAYPPRGILLLVTVLSSSSYISRFTMNGTLMAVFQKHSYRDVNLVNIDYEENRLYWIESYNCLARANLDGTDNTKIFLSVLFPRVQSIFIYGQWIYLSDTHKLYRVNKKTGSYGNLASPLHYYAQIEASGVKLINQIQVNENPCQINNGGCEQFCFYNNPKVTCDCADGFQVTSKRLCSP